MNRSFMRSLGRPLAGWAARLVHEQDGAVAVLVALCMVVLMGFMTLVLDVGVLFVDQTQLQKTVDAAALAGAQDIGVAGYPANAQADALTYASYNGSAAAEVVTNQAASIFSANDAWTVTATRTINLAFAPVIGIPQSAVTATATAIKSPLLSLPAADVLPFALWGGNPGGSSLDQYCVVNSQYAQGACDSNGGISPGSPDHYIYRSNSWPKDVVYPDPSKCGGRYPACNPLWQLDARSNFHGFFNNMPSGSLQIGSTISVSSSGGTGSTPALCQYTAYTGGSPTAVIVPVIGRTTVQSGQYSFYIAAWRAAYLDTAHICPNEDAGQAWTLTVAPDQTVHVGNPGGNDPNAPMVLKLWQ